MPIILGADKSGKSLLAGILNCSPQICYESLLISSLDYSQYKKFGLSLLDRLYDQFSHDEKFIWIIRNPLESCCSMNNVGISHQKALSYWEDINTIIWYFLNSVPQNRKINIKFEEMLLKNSIIKSVFDFSSIIFKDQYLKYGDFDQFVFNDPVFLKGDIDGEKVNFYEHKEDLCTKWNKIKNKKIIMKLGYTKE